MDRIKEMLDRISELSDQELSELEGEVLSEFEKLEKEATTAQTVDAMTSLADALDTVRAESNQRAQAAAELARRVEEVKARVKGAEAPEEVGEPGATEPAAEAAAGDDDGSAPHEYAPGPDGKCTVCGKDAADAVHVPAVAASAAAAVADAPAEAEAATEPEAAPAAAETAAATEPEAAQATSETTPADTSEADAPVAANGEKAQEQAAATPDADAPATADAPDTTAADTPSAGDAAAETTPVATTEDTDTTAEAAPAAKDETGEDKSEDTVTASAATPEASEPVVTAPADRQPVPRATATVAITAGADIPGVSAGSPLDNMTAVAEAMAKRMHQMRRTNGGDGEQHTVATIVASFPEDRVLKSNDPDGNAAKLEKVVSPEAITAAGGICAPVNVQYDLFGLGTLGRPVRDALASFNADRGGIRFVTPPTLTDLNGAASLWTLQDDIDAATDGAPDPVKPCLRVACGAEVTVYTDAIPLCLTFGNMGARAYPELVARHNELAMIHHARFAETRLLTRIGSLSTAVTSTKKVGAVPDFLATVDRATAAYRNRHRMDDRAPLRILAPLWFKDMMRADMAYRMPGDNLEGNLAIADAKILSFFRERDVNISWFMDGEAGQVFGAQGAGSLLDFPDNVIWYLFAEGTFLFLDGGTLDLGLVRDSTLNATNDYKMFIETFEGVAKVGIESLRVTSRLEPTGMVGGTVDLTAGVAA